MSVEFKDPWVTIARRAEFTPDWEELCMSTQSKFLVFIHGNLRKGKQKQNMLKDRDYYGEALTFSQNFILKRCSYSYNGREVDPEPILLQLPIPSTDKFWRDNPYLKWDQMLRVCGDVYAVTPSDIADLDHYLDNAYGVTRTKIYVNFLNQSKNLGARLAFAYIQDTDEYMEFASSGENLYNCQVCEKPHFGKFYSY